MVFVVFEVVLVVVELRETLEVNSARSHSDNNVKALSNIILLSKLRWRLHTLI